MCGVLEFGRAENSKHGGLYKPPAGCPSTLNASCCVHVLPLSGLLVVPDNGALLPSQHHPQAREDNRQQDACAGDRVLDMGAMATVLLRVRMRVALSEMLCSLCLPFSWLAWTCDALDFFSVSLSVTALEKQFGKSAHTIVRVHPVLYFS